MQSHDVLDRGQSRPGTERKGGHRNVPLNSMFESKQLFSPVRLSLCLRSKRETKETERTRKASNWRGGDLFGSERAQEGDYAPVC